MRKAHIILLETPKEKQMTQHKKKKKKKIKEIREMN